MGEGQRELDQLRIWLMVNHDAPEISHSIYKIEPPSDLSESETEDAEGFMVNQSEKSIYFKAEERNKPFILGTQMVKLGSNLYFIGGLVLDEEQQRQVYVLDTDEPRLRKVASMKHPKEYSCIFTANGKIYALSGQDGNFECYHPEMDKWEELHKAPHPLSWTTGGFDWSDCATVIGRLVFIAYGDRCMVYDLKSKVWYQELLPAEFVCGDTLCVNGSLYYLWGEGAHRPGSPVKFELTGDYWQPLQIIKKDLLSDNKQVMVEESEIDKDNFYTDFRPWRKLFHLYDNYFCYVLTTILVDYEKLTVNDSYSRAVFINVFEEVNDNSSKSSYFRSVASFSYKITTPFRTYAYSVCGCASGTLPHSWIAERKKEEMDYKELPVVTKWVSEQMKKLKAANNGLDKADASYHKSSKMKKVVKT